MVVLIPQSAGASTPYIWRIMRENDLGSFLLMFAVSFALIDKLIQNNF